MLSHHKMPITNHTSIERAQPSCSKGQQCTSGLCNPMSNRCVSMSDMRQNCDTLMRSMLGIEPGQGCNNTMKSVVKMCSSDKIEDQDTLCKVLYPHGSADHLLMCAEIGGNCKEECTESCNRNGTLCAIYMRQVPQNLLWQVCYELIFKSTSYYLASNISRICDISVSEHTVTHN